MGGGSSKQRVAPQSADQSKLQAENDALRRVGETTMKASPLPNKKSAVSSTDPPIRQQKLANANNNSAWLPPSTRPQAEALKKNIQELQDLLVTEGSWSQEQKEAVEIHIQAARAYLDACKAAAVQEIPLLKEIRAKLETKYVKAYAAVSEVISQDDPAWPKLLVLGQQMESNKARAFCQSRTKLIAMYEDAVEIKPTFDDIFGTIAGTTNGKFTGAPPKRIFRALEKTVMKPAGHPNLDMANNVCDVIRGMIVYDKFGDMIRGIEATAKHEDVVLMRTKDRYSSPTSGGWMDLVVNLSFKSDRNAHVCEIQFIHQGLLAVRKMCGGHHVYNTFRSALELLETHNALALRRASAVDTSLVTAWLEENGVKTKSGELSSVLTQLNVTSVLDLASLDETDTNKVLQLMNNLQKKKWNQKEIPTKLDTCVASVIEKANEKSTVVEWLQVLCLDGSGAATWLEENGPYEEMGDVKELEAEDEQNLVEATRMNGGAAQAARVGRALAILKGVEWGGENKEKTRINTDDLMPSPNLPATSVHDTKCSALGFDAVETGDVTCGPGSYYFSDKTITEMHENIKTFNEALQFIEADDQTGGSNPIVMWQLTNPWDHDAMDYLVFHRQKFLSQNLDASTGKTIAEYAAAIADYQKEITRGTPMYVRRTNWAGSKATAPASLAGTTQLCC